MRLHWLSYFFLFSLLACNGKNHLLKIKGSDTEVNLSVLLAEAYHQRHDDRQLSISGGGSGLGIASLLNGLADIANSSRPINSYEQQLFKQKGTEIVSFVFAQDALAIIVHEDLSIDSLSIEEVRKIFSGKKAGWQFSASDQFPISLYGRQSNSGTHSYLKDKLGIEFSLYAKEMNGNAQIIEAVKADKGGIGYVGAGYVVKNGKQQGSGYKILKIYEKNRPACSPLDYYAVLHKRYYFQRPLYQYVLKSAYAKAKPLLEFEKSIEGQKIIVANGYFPITSSTRE
ncbi:PstS family phosphate ABC transporter substrate-binding protein [Runella sp.]|uniref:PstS family phosphate ABC transporter substrate-binding protein n=1 Tax=Runella sp. TaxID=1960881 RepID=UPI003D11CA42